MAFTLFLIELEIGRKNTAWQKMRNFYSDFTIYLWIYIPFATHIQLLYGKSTLLKERPEMNYSQIYKVLYFNLV